MSIPLFAMSQSTLPLDSGASLLAALFFFLLRTELLFPESGLAVFYGHLRTAQPVGQTFCQFL